MITDLLLAATLGLGQAPVPVAMPIGVLPSQPTGGMVMMMQDPGAPAAPATPGAPGHIGGQESAPFDPATMEKYDAGDEPAKKYFIMRTLEGSWLGNKMEDRSWSIYGWTEGNYTIGTTRVSTLPTALNDQSNVFQMNQNYLVIEKAIDTEKKEIQFGLRMDWILPGTDYRFTLPRGMWNQQLVSNNGTPEPYGVDLFQQYLDVYLPGLGEGTTVRVGRFGTIIGYELVQAVDTPFVSRSYNFQYNPFSHTGVFATTTLNDNWTMGNGFVLGSDNYWGGNTNRLNYLGQLRWAPPEGNTSIAFNTMITNPKYDTTHEFAQYNTYNILLTHKLSDSLTYVLDSTASHMYGIPDVGTAWWYGFANYLVKNHTDDLTSTFRLELFEDATGFRTGGKGLYTAATYGLTWNPVDALLIRPGVRYDVNSESSPFEGDNSLFTAWIDLIWRW